MWGTPCGIVAHMMYLGSIVQVDRTDYFVFQSQICASSKDTSSSIQYAVEGSRAGLSCETWF